MGFFKRVSQSLGISGTSMKGVNKAAEEAKIRQSDATKTNLARYQPFMTAGTQGVGALSSAMGLGGDNGQAGYGSLVTPFSMQQFQEDPSYQFRLGEGEKAIERARASRGSSMSPDAIKELTKYGSNLASQEYGDAFERNRAEQSDLYGRLSGMAGMGQETAGSMGSITQLGADRLSGIGSQQAQAILSAKLADNARLKDSIVTGGKMAMASDKTLKENIVKVGKEKGHNIYEFNYKDGSGRFRGVIAQEVQKIKPEAVVKKDGKLAVYYDMLGLRMEKV